MPKRVMIAITLLVLASIAAVAAEDYRDVIYARQGQFYILEYNLGVLEAMAAGDMPYERDTAIKRAENIELVLKLNQDMNWLPGSTTTDTPRTRVQGLDKDRAAFKHGMLAMVGASENLMTVTRNGPPSTLRRAAAQMRETCNGCHQYYRPGY